MKDVKRATDVDRTYRTEWNWYVRQRLEVDSTPTWDEFEKREDRYLLQVNGKPATIYEDLFDTWWSARLKTD